MFKIFEDFWRFLTSFFAAADEILPWACEPVVAGGAAQWPAGRNQRHLASAAWTAAWLASLASGGATDCRSACAARRGWRSSSNGPRGSWPYGRPTCATRGSNPIGCCGRVTSRADASRRRERRRGRSAAPLNAPRPTGRQFHRPFRKNAALPFSVLQWIRIHEFNRNRMWNPHRTLKSDWISIQLEEERPLNAATSLPQRCQIENDERSFKFPPLSLFGAFGISLLLLLLRENPPAGKPKENRKRTEREPEDCHFSRHFVTIFERRVMACSSKKKVIWQRWRKLISFIEFGGWWFILIGCNYPAAVATMSPWLGGDTKCDHDQRRQAVNKRNWRKISIKSDSRKSMSSCHEIQSRNRLPARE